MTRELTETDGQQLRSSDVGERRRMVRRVGSLPNGLGFLSELKQCLTGDPVWSVREAAAESLGKIARHPEAAEQLPEQVRTLLLTTALHDSSVYVREVSREQILLLNTAWEQTFSVLDEVWSNERTHLRRRALLALSEFDSIRSCAPSLEQALSESHWKLRSTAAIELRNHPQHFAASCPIVIRRCFDHHSSVALRARETIDHFRNDLPPVIVKGLDEAKDYQPETMLNRLLQTATNDVLNEFREVCLRRLAWHKLEVASADSEVHSLVDACVQKCRRSSNEDRRVRREYTWMASELSRIILNR